MAQTPAPPRLSTRRVGRRAGALGVVHLLCVELVLLVVSAAALTSRVLLVPAGAGCLIALLVVFGRVRRRWWYEEAAARWGLRRRRREAARTTARLAAAEPGVRAMAALVPALAIRNALDRGRAIGVGSDEQGWFAAVQVASWPDAFGHRALRLDADLLARLIDESSVPVSMLQLVCFQTLAAPPPAASDGPAARSYRELAAGCPLDQSFWLVARLTPADAVEAASSRGGGVGGVDKALAAVIARIENSLAAAGVPHRVLDAEGLTEALALSCGLDSLAPPRSGRPPVLERWTSWLAGDREHVSFTVTGWPRDPGRDLLAALSGLPAGAVGVCVGVWRRGESFALLGLVRVVAPSSGRRQAVRRLAGAARRLGLRLRRLDGEQARGVYATAPTAALG